MASRFFRRQWHESRGDDHAAWGRATYFFETDDALIARRQIEVYDSGQRLRYDEAHPEDEHGYLSFGPIFPEDEWPELFEISALEFEAEWNKPVST
jgi:hypothetical protein